MKPRLCRTCTLVVLLSALVAGCASTDGWRAHEGDMRVREGTIVAVVPDEDHPRCGWIVEWGEGRDRDWKHDRVRDENLARKIAAFAGTGAVIQASQTYTNVRWGRGAVCFDWYFTEVVSR